MSIFTIIAIAFFIISSIFLAIAVALFVRLEIISVIGDLSGKTAKKQIDKIKKGNRITTTSSPGQSKVDFDIFSIKSNASDPSLPAKRKAEVKVDNYCENPVANKKKIVYNGEPVSSEGTDYLGTSQDLGIETDVLAKDENPVAAVSGSSAVSKKTTGTEHFGAAADEAHGTEVLSDTVLAPGTIKLDEDEPTTTEMLSDIADEAHGTEVLSDTEKATEKGPFEILSDQVQVFTNEVID